MFAQEASRFTFQDAESHFMARRTDGYGNAGIVERKNMFLECFRQGCEGVKDLLMFGEFALKQVHKKSTLV